MNTEPRSPWYYIVHWLRFYFGAHLLFSGLRYAVTGYVPDVPGIGGAWMQANANIYMYQMIKYLEIVTGAMIFFNRFTLLGLILEMPATVNIFWLNTFIVATPRQLFTGPQELFMNGLLLLAYSGWMFGAVRPKLEPLWIWEGRKAYEPDLGGRVGEPSLSTRFDPLKSLRRTPWTRASGSPSSSASASRRPPTSARRACSTRSSARSGTTT
jgi:hypothetical protein